MRGDEGAVSHDVTIDVLAVASAVDGRSLHPCSGMEHVSGWGWGCRRGGGLGARFLQGHKREWLRPVCVCVDD